PNTKAPVLKVGPDAVADNRTHFVLLHSKPLELWPDANLAKREQLALESRGNVEAVEAHAIRAVDGAVRRLVAVFHSVVLGVVADAEEVVEQLRAVVLGGHLRAVVLGGHVQVGLAPKHARKLPDITQVERLAGRRKVGRQRLLGTERLAPEGIAPVRDAAPDEQAIIDIIAKKQGWPGVVEAVVFEVEAVRVVVAAHACHPRVVDDAIAPGAADNADFVALALIAGQGVHVVAADAVEANFIGHAVKRAVVKHLAQLALLADFLHHHVGLVVGQARYREFLSLLRAAYFHDVAHQVGVLGGYIGQQVAAALKLGHNLSTVLCIDFLGPPL
nr:hypothetical protein [Tanacetum cinerariifolium]